MSYVYCVRMFLITKLSYNISIYKLKLKIKNLIMFINVWYVSVGL